MIKPTQNYVLYSKTGKWNFWLFNLMIKVDFDQLWSESNDKIWNIKHHKHEINKVEQ